MDNPDTVERVARALADCASANWDAQHIGETPGGESPDEMRDGFRDMARAAIAALTTPADGLAEELGRLHEAARGCEFDLVPADGPIARLALFMHENGDRILTALRAAQPTERATLPTMTYAPPHLEYAATDQHDAWLLRFADQDCGDQWFGGDDYTPDETRALAIDAWNRYAPAWSVRLMRTVTLNEVRGADTPATASQDAGEAFQNRVDAWMDACFGGAIKADMLERADRFCEEALELVQTVQGFGPERAHALVDYVFGRPVGVRFQEVGGVRVTLSALCNADDINEDGAAETELARVWTKVEQIRAKQAAKPTGSALPIALATPPEPSGQSDAVGEVS